MKHVILFTFISLVFVRANAQNVGIGTSTPNSNAALEIKSNAKGLLMPRTSSISRTAMANVPKGMMVYDTTYSSFYFHDGSKWRLFNEYNTDSLVKDNINNPQETVNMPLYVNNAFTYAASGILYDNGGPAGNYSSNSVDGYAIAIDDSTVGYKVIIEQMNLEIHDTLGIYLADNQAGMVLFTGTTVGTYYFPGTSHLGFVFISNATINNPGFKIRWSRVTATTDPSNNPPSFGWYFNAKKIAVRAGISSDNNWATDSLGRLSFAYGNRAKAKGMFAVAMGDNVSSSGNYSTAFGLNNTASGDYSFATGAGTTASGYNSIGMGWKANASGSNAIALGQNCEASENYTTAIGANCIANEQHARSFGSGCIASGPFSTAIGQSSSASNTYATAIGSFNIASGPFATAFGNKTTASGDNSTTMGDSTIATGFTSTAMGNKTTASGSYSTATGLGTTAKSYGSFVAGVYNVSSGSQFSWVSTDPLFVIGNGSSSAPSNALMVLKNGNVGIGTNAPAEKLSVEGDMIVNNPAGGTIIQLQSDAVQKGFVQLSGDNLRLGTYSSNNLGTVIFRLNGADRFTINPNGNATLTGTLTQNSDAKFKDGIEPIDNALDKVMQLNGYRYHWKPELKRDSATQVGLIAQNVESVFPELVTTNKEGDKSVAYQNMVAVLIEAIKEQQLQMQAMQKRIAELEKK